MKINAGEIPLEPMFFIPDGHEPPKGRKKCKSPFEVLKGSANWRGEYCSLTLAQLVDFIDYVRVVTLRIKEIYQQRKINDYLDVLRHIEGKVMQTVSAYDGLAIKPEPGKDWDIIVILLCNVCRLIPTPANLTMIKDFYDRLISREEQLNGLHIAVK